MYFQFHNFTHDENEVNVTMITEQRMFSPRNQQVFIRKTLTIDGHFCATGQTTIKARIAELQNSYKNEWHSVGLYHEDGTPSAHVLDFATSLNGIRVLTLDFPCNEGGEYVTGRSYHAVFQADYATTSTLESEIYMWEETLQITGNGGMDWELIPQFQGPPVFQINSMMTPQHIIQSGQNIGVSDYITPPQPYWPERCHKNRTIIQRETCQKKGRNWSLLFPTKWTYFHTLQQALDIYGPLPPRV
jgi:hypothetical protein